jgi:hypothetical protein
MQSNLAIEEELVRISAYLEPAVGPACRNEECECVGVPLPAAPENRRADYVNAVLDKGINWEFALRNVG